MQIKSVLARGADLAAPARGSERAEPPGNKTAASVLEPPSASLRGDAARNILSQYDVTDISPQALRQMLRRLRQAGAISDRDFQELAAIPAELERDGVRPDEEINLLKRYQEKLATLAGQFPPSNPGTPPTNQPQAAAARRQLDWLQKFALIQSGDAPAGLDAAA